MTPIAPHITAFLQKRLAVERCASRHTCDSYAYAFQLLFEFASRKLGVAPSDLHLEQIDPPLVVEFLDHLQTERHNCPARTRRIGRTTRVFESDNESSVNQTGKTAPNQQTFVR